MTLSCTEFQLQNNMYTDKKRGKSVKLTSQRRLPGGLSSQKKKEKGNEKHIAVWQLCRCSVVNIVKHIHFCSPICIWENLKSRINFTAAILTGKHPFYSSWNVGCGVRTSVLLSATKAWHLMRIRAENSVHLGQWTLNNRSHCTLVLIFLTFPD